MIMVAVMVVIMMAMMVAIRMVMMVVIAMMIMLAVVMVAVGQVVPSMELLTLVQVAVVRVNQDFLQLAQAVQA
jgi:hypothetical protein